MLNIFCHKTKIFHLEFAAIPLIPLTFQCLPNVPVNNLCLSWNLFCFCIFFNLNFFWVSPFCPNPLRPFPFCHAPASAALRLCSYLQQKLIELLCTVLWQQAKSLFVCPTRLPGSCRVSTSQPIQASGFHCCCFFINSSSFFIFKLLVFSENVYSDPFSKHIICMF